MWDRKVLKAKGKAAFNRNYWKCVLTTMILSLLTGGTATAAYRQNSGEIKESMNLLRDAMGAQNLTSEQQLVVLLGIAAVVFGVILFAAAVNGAVRIFVGYAFEVGGCSFFLKNAEEPVPVKEVLNGFKQSYLRNVLTLFLRDLYLTLWSLLFGVPGFIKHYSYLLVPYILADSPEMSRKEAFLLSRKLMDGNKWNAFVLDLSFVGWILLNAMTLGVLGTFYVNPYVRATHAELYRTLRYGY